MRPDIADDWGIRDGAGCVNFERKIEIYRQVTRLLFLSHVNGTKRAG